MANKISKTQIDNFRIIKRSFVDQIHDFIFVDNPEGGIFWEAGANYTGAIKIKLPVLWGNTFINFKVKIQDYGIGFSDESLVLNISSYIRSVTSQWERCTVQNISSIDGKDFTVRFGHDGVSSCLWIGETNSNWNYLGVIVSDFTGYFQNADEQLSKGWSISMATAFDTIQVTKNNNLPYSDFNKIKNKAGSTVTGTELSLSNIVGNNYNYAAFSSATTYTTVNPVINGFARCFINAASEPTVTGATKKAGAAFTANVNMEMVVESPDGTAVEFYFVQRV